MRDQKTIRRNVSRMCLVMNEKHILKSKTIWVMVIMFLASFFPVVNDYIGGNDGNAWVLQVVTAIGVLLRLITKDRVVLFSDDDGPLFPVWLVMVCMSLSAVIGGMTLSSCTPNNSVPVRASYTDKSGNVYAYDPATGVSVRIIEAAK